MIRSENLDIRTITMGISLLDCASPSPRETRHRIYDKITRRAARLVSVGEALEEEFGIPIIHKRISITPLALVTGSWNAEGSAARRELKAAAITLDQAAQETGVNFLGGFSALVPKGATPADTALMNALPEALASTERVCGSVNLATSRAGINMDAVALMGRVIKETATLSADQDALGCAKLVVFANAPEDNPFMAGAFHGPGEPDTAIHVGLSGPGVIHSALQQLSPEAPFDEVANVIKKTAFKITRLGELVAREASLRLDAPFGIIDLSLAPTPAVGDSVARIFEVMGLESAGIPGTTAALALLNDAVKKGGIMASSHVGGLSGAFIPVSEDEGMIEAVEKGAMGLAKLEAMTSVCSVGLDMVVVPGDTPAETLSGLIADEAAIGISNNKTTALRVIPVPGKKPGDSVEFGGLLGRAPVMEVPPWSSRAFIARGGRIPAPLQSFRN